MGEDSNPYQPPAVLGGEEESYVPPWRKNQFYVVWIWSGVSTIGAAAITPADGLSCLFVMNCGLIAFLLGAGLSAVKGMTAGTLATKVLLLPVGCFFLTVCLAGLRIHALHALTFPVANALLGALSMLGVVHHRRRVFFSIAVAFPLGSLLGMFGGLLFTWVALFLCGRDRGIESVESTEGIR